MFQMSMWEIGLILVIALIVLGPRQLAETAKAVGKMYRELAKMVDDLRSSVDLDSMISGPNHYEPRPPGEPTKTDNEEIHQVADPAGQSGPDFYAELLEQSTEEEASDGEKSGTAGKEIERKTDKEPGDQENEREREGSPT